MAQVRIVPHSSPEYRDTVELRLSVLRRPLGLDLSEDQLATESGDIHFAAYDGDRLVGCLILVPKPDKTVKMRQVAVDDALQGRGIGSEMVRACEIWAKGEGYALMELNARETAVPFYLRLGYQTEGEGFIEVSIPHRRMVKRL